MTGEMLAGWILNGTGDGLDYYEDGVVTGARPFTPEEQAMVAAAPAAAAAAESRRVAVEVTRTALTDALNLATLYPAPSPEENAIIDSQVAAALAGFRDLSNPPADVVALAAAVVSWRATT